MYNGLFARPLSPESAYWLGLIVADGSVGRYGHAYRFSLGLRRADRTLVEELARDLGYAGKVRFNAASGQTRLQVNNRALFGDLDSLGIHPRKSRALTYKVIPAIHQSHFVRGVFDGDGSVGAYHAPEMNRLRPHFSITGHGPFLEALALLLPVRGRVSLQRATHRTFVLQVQRRADFGPLFEWLYRGATRYLDRKRMRFEEAVAS